MDRRLPNHPSNFAGPSDSTGRRRARSYSQPVASPVPGPSHRAPDPFEFLNNPYSAGPSVAAAAPFDTLAPDFDDEALLRSILSMSEDQHNPQTHIHPFHLPNGPPMPPPQHIPQMPNQQQHVSNPLLSQTFVAWLQYMQLQMHLQQQTQGHQGPHHGAQQQQQQHLQNFLQQQHQQQAQMQQQHVPFPMGGHSRPAAESPTVAQEPPSPTPTNTPSPDAHNHGEIEQVVTAEEKRRRNTAASARFRVKKKQWTLNLERSITDLSGRVEELEREAAELRRENGWLKEIVMLKSKRFGGPAPNLDPPPAPADEPGNEADSGDEGGEKSEGSVEPSSKGKEKETQR